MGSAQVGCHQFLSRVWLYLDKETDPPTCAEFESHLAGCADCRRIVQFDLRFKQLVRRCADTGPVPASAVESLRARLQARLQHPPDPQSV